MIGYGPISQPRAVRLTYLSARGLQEAELWMNNKMRVVPETELQARWEGWTARLVTAKGYCKMFATTDSVCAKLEWAVMVDPT